MKSEKGQSLVEFALVLPVLLLVLFGIVDFGRAFHTYLAIDHAGREAARAASVGKSESEAKLAAVSSGSSVNITTGHVNVIKGTSGSEARVVITYPFKFITPVIGNMFSGGFTITNTTVMRVE